MPSRVWTNNTGLALSAANMNGIEADLDAIRLSIATAFPVVIAPIPSGSDDVPALNALIAANPTKALSLRAGSTYIFNTTLVPTASIYGNGAKINSTGMAAASALAQRFAIRPTGTAATALVVTTAIAIKSRVVAGISSTATLAAGDLVVVYNDEQPVPGMTRTDRDKGEMNVIATVDSGVQVTLRTGVMQAMGTTGLRIQKITPVEDIFINNLDITMGGVASGHNAIEFNLGRNCEVYNVKVTGAEDSGISFRTVMYGSAHHNYIRKSTSSTTLGLTGYGIAVIDGSRHVTVHHNDLEDSRHHIAGGGKWPAIFVYVERNVGRNSSSAGLDCHESTMNWWFYRNTIENSTHGIFVRGQNITVDDNVFRDISAEMIGVHTYDDVSEQRGIRIIRNKGFNCGYGISVGKASGETTEFLSYDVEVIGNWMEDCGINPIRVRYADNVEVSDNDILGVSTAAAILIDGISASLPNKNVVASGNRIKGHGTIGLHVKFFEKAKAMNNVIVGGSAEGIFFEGDATTKSKNVTYGGNDIDTAGASGIRVLNVNVVNGSGGEILTPTINGIWYKDCTRTNTTGVTVYANAQYGIFYDGGSNHALGNPHVSGGTGSSPAYDAVRAVGVTDLSITGGFLASPRYAVYTTTSDWISVIGTNVHTTSNATKINSDATNKVITPVL